MRKILMLVAVVCLCATMAMASVYCQPSTGTYETGYGGPLQYSFITVVGNSVVVHGTSSTGTLDGTGGVTLSDPDLTDFLGNKFDIQFYDEDDDGEVDWYYCFTWSWDDLNNNGICDEDEQDSLSLDLGWPQGYTINKIF